MAKMAASSLQILAKASYSWTQIIENNPFPLKLGCYGFKPFNCHLDTLFHCRKSF